MTVRLVRLLAISALVASLCLSEAILHGRENVQGEPYQHQRDLKMSSKTHYFSRGKGKGMGKSSSKSSKSGKGKGKGKGKGQANRWWHDDRRSPPPPTRPPILNLVDQYQLRRTTAVPTWTPPVEELSAAPQPTPPTTLAPVIGTTAPPPQQPNPTTISPTLSPTVLKTAPPTRDTSPPPTWSDTPQPTVARTLQRTNLFARAQPRQAELDCQLTAGGLFGMPSATSSVYQVQFLYQIYVAAGTTEAVLRSQVAPLLDQRVTELILPAFFDCSSGNRRARRFLQSTQSIEGISSRPEDEILFIGLPCTGESREGSDCYVVDGYISVFASGFRTQQDLEEFVLPEIRKILQGNGLSNLIPQVTGAQNLNDDLSPMEPTVPAPAPSPTVPTTAEPPTGDEAPTLQPANATEPPANRPSPLVPTPPTTPEVPPTNVEPRSAEDESFLDKMEWWGWILLVLGGLIVFSVVLTCFMNSKQPSHRQPGQPMRSDDDRHARDNSAAYKPPGENNYNNGYGRSATANNTGGRSQVAPATSDRDIGRFQTTPAAYGNTGRYEAASAAPSPARRFQTTPAANDNTGRYEAASAAPAPAAVGAVGGGAAAAAVNASAARKQPSPASSPGSARYQPSSAAAVTPATLYQPPPATPDVGRFLEAPPSQELGQLGSVDEAASYHHSVAYEPENQPPPTERRYNQPQQESHHEEEVSEYEEYIEEEYIEEGTGTGSGEYEDVEEEYVEEIHEEGGDESYESYEEEEEVFIEDHS